MDDALQCQICIQVYNGAQRIPMIIKCGHTYCQRCIKKFQQKQCPLCKISFTEYNKNITLIKLMDQRITEQKNRKLSQKIVDEFFKISFIGQMGVGKTSIIKAFKRQQFQQKMNSTIGHDLKIIKQQYNGKNYTFQIWDTGGQQRYRTIVRTQYRDSDMIIIAYSLDETRSFKEIINFWMKEVKQYCNDSIIFILGNKCDTKQEIEQGLISNLINNNNFYHQKVSCKQSININKTWKKIRDLLIERRQMQLRKNSKLLLKEHETKKKYKIKSQIKSSEKSNGCKC